MEPETPAPTGRSGPVSPAPTGRSGPRQELPATAKDAFYTAVGFAVLATQRFQVRRREVQKQVEPAVREAAGRLREAASSVDDRVDPVLDQLASKLPDTGRDVVRQARVVAKGARDTVIDLAAGEKASQATDR